jgi:hypothetical protein
MLNSQGSDMHRACTGHTCIYQNLALQGELVFGPNTTGATQQWQSQELGLSTPSTPTTSSRPGLLLGPQPDATPKSQADSSTTSTPTTPSASGAGSGAPGSPRPFRFLSTFKWESRKGWDVLLAAYLQEFTAEVGVEGWAPVRVGADVEGTGGCGTFAGVSHIWFLCCPPPHLPYCLCFRTLMHRTMLSSPS